MKRLFAWCTTALLLLSLATPVLAAGHAEIVRSFVYNDELYTYVDIQNSSSPVTKAEVNIGPQSFPTSGKLETVEQAGSPVSYLLLVDCSNSMSPFVSDVRTFAQALAERAGESTRFALATLGDGFTLLAEDLKQEELLQELDNISYDVIVTRLNRAIDSALNYFDSMPRQRNELRTLIVLTDAVEYDPQGGISDEALLERVKTSDVMVHALGVGSDHSALSSLSNLVQASGGVSCFVDTESPAIQAAESIAGFVNSLYVTSFNLIGCTTAGEDIPLSMVFSSGAELLCRAETTVDLPEQSAEGLEDSPVTPAPLPPSTHESTPVQTASQESATAHSAKLFPLVIGSSAVLLLVIAVIAALKRKKRPASVQATSSPVPPSAVPQPIPSSVYLRLDLREGSCAAQEFQLQTELTAGSDPTCELSFTAEGISPRHARIFLSSNGICIEDLNSQNGTKVNGQPLLGPTRLRSGDEITIGSACFSLKF